MADLNFTFTCKIQKGSLFDHGGHVFGPMDLMVASCLNCGEYFTAEQFLRGGFSTCKKAVGTGQCECGAAKTSGAGAGSPCHSSWCPQASLTPAPSPIK